MAIDDETLELLERRLAERVEARVRGKLFKLYGGIGSGILAGFGLLGYDLYGDFKETVNDTAKGYAEAAVKGSVADAQAAAGEARAAAETAETQARDAGAKLAAMDEWRHLGATKLQGALETLGDLTAKVGGSQTELETRLAGMRARMEEAEARIESARARGETYFLNAQYEQVILDLSAEVERMDRELDALSRSALEMAALLADPSAVRPGGPDLLAGIEPGAGDPATEPAPQAPALGPPPEMSVEPAPRQTALIQDKAQQLAEPRGVTVFIQFAGVARAAAERLASARAADGYDAPGVERVETALGMRELRYFYESDAERAALAALDADAALSSLGFATGVTPKLLGWVKTKPRPGVFELWVEPRLTRDEARR
ncbi:MAG: hypothetical protein VX463_07935 [Pseudomonadota bacterium]|nr:hypothetical protein [Pseudomonadota bacterium]